MHTSYVTLNTHMYTYECTYKLKSIRNKRKCSRARRTILVVLAANDVNLHHKILYRVLHKIYKMIVLPLDVATENCQQCTSGFQIQEYVALERLMHF